MKPEKRILDGDAVDKMIEHNDRQSELHRIAFGKASFNEAIDKAIEVVKGYREAGYTHHAIGAIIEKLKALKK